MPKIFHAGEGMLDIGAGRYIGMDCDGAFLSIAKMKKRRKIGEDTPKKSALDLKKVDVVILIHNLEAAEVFKAAIDAVITNLEK